MSSIYNNKSLRYPLTDNEMKCIDDVWIIIDIYRESRVTRYEYEKYISEKIRLLYTKKQYYEYEIMIEKMYWNLFELVINNFERKPEIYAGNKDELKMIKRTLLLRIMF